MHHPPGTQKADNLETLQTPFYGDISGGFLKEASSIINSIFSTRPFSREGAGSEE